MKRARNEFNFSLPSVEKITELSNTSYRYLSVDGVRQVSFSPISHWVICSHSTVRCCSLLNRHDIHIHIVTLWKKEKQLPAARSLVGLVCRSCWRRACGLNIKCQVWTREMSAISSRSLSLCKSENVLQIHREISNRMTSALSTGVHCVSRL